MTACFWLVFQFLSHWADERVSSRIMTTEFLKQSPDAYSRLLNELKERIRAARTRAALAVNEEMVLLYWAIGREILVRQGEEGWGAHIVARLAVDLRREFPEMTGLSARNLKYIRTLEHF
jgi:hypothetical protein